MTGKIKIGLLLVGLSAALTINWTSFTTKAQDIGESDDETDDPEPEIDETIATCAAFVKAESHIDNVWIARQARDVYRLQREEIASYDFVNWYKNGGRQQLLTAGDFCSFETFTKSGKEKGLEARAYVAEVEQRNADFFAQKMTKRCQE